MAEFAWVLLVVMAGCMAGGATAWLVSAYRGQRAPKPEPWSVVVARRVVVNLKSGTALDGVLVRKDGPLLFLKNAVLLEQGQEPAPVDGEAVVQCSQVDFIQAL